MIWNRQNNLSVVELGAINGFVFGSLLELSLRSIYLYETYSFDKTPSAGLSICFFPYPFSWWFFPVFCLVLVTAASYFVNYFLSQRIKSPFWFWQTVGILSVFGACLYSIGMVLYYWFISEVDILGVEHLVEVTPSEAFFVLPATPVVICFNFLFAIILQVWKKRLL